MAERTGIAAIVLAAGSSSRFGADKLRHPYPHKGITLPLSAHSLLPWLQVFDRVTVVVRAEALPLRMAIEAALGRQQAAQLRWAICSDAAEGMGASLCCGVQANQAASGWLIGLADMPEVPAQAIMQVRAALASGASIVAPVHGGRRGHPVGFDAVWLNALLSLQGDEGARSVLQAHASAITLLPLADAGIYHDVDRRADLPDPARLAK